MKRITLVFSLLFIAATAGSQIIDPVKWSFEAKQNGNDIELNFIAAIDWGWHFYDTDLPDDGRVVPTQIVFDDSTLFAATSEIFKNPQPVAGFDSVIQLHTRYFVNNVTLTQNIRLPNNLPTVISGYIRYLCCNNKVCLAAPHEAPFSFSFNHHKNTAVEETAAIDAALPYTPLAGAGTTLPVFILISVLAGFAAVLTPCVFPVIPVTVSFFMKRNETRRKAAGSGIVFGGSIVLIFTLFGALFSFGVFGPNTAMVLSIHWIPNLLFFVLFIVFSVSFLGAFDMVLPGSLANKFDARANKGGMFGIFFMALTTVIVSFSCTGPFTGAIIVEAIQGGGMRPVTGMFFFGLSFAAPFTVLAIFPQVLNRLPKSSTWLNVVKVVFAFILMALGMKFLTNIDQVYGLGIISREIYLSVWIVIFFLLGLYLLGKIKFRHDSHLPYLGAGRLFLAIANFSFAVYLFTGFFGNQLASISSLIPPASTQPVFATQNTNNAYTAELCTPAKYTDRLHLPNGLPGYFDFEQGMACAKQQGKPALVVFKGHTCANCKKMENIVWTNPDVLKIVSEKYILIGLYTDNRTTLPESEWTISRINGKLIKQMGKKNLDIEISEYNTNTIPFHVIIQPDGTTHTFGSTFRDDEFKAFLEQGI